MNMHEAIVYINLRQGLQALKEEVSKMRFVYFRSTDVERKNYERLLWSVPDEMLFFLALGYRVRIIDASTKKRGKIERIFVPVLCDLLNFIWFKKEPKNKKLVDHFRIALHAVKNNRKLYAKFRIWRKVAKKVLLEAETLQVGRELNDEELSKLMLALASQQ